MKPTKTNRSTAQHVRRMDDGNAFMPDPGAGPARTRDDLAEQLAEQFLVSATSAEEAGQEDLDLEMPEERGGPFVLTRASKEFGREPDASNIPEAEPAAFPSAMRSYRQDLVAKR